MQKETFWLHLYGVTLLFKYSSKDYSNDTAHGGSQKKDATALGEGRGV
ncbi:MAG: hypothetical protein QXR44_03680 [Thermoproteota archaeon]